MMVVLSGSRSLLQITLSHDSVGRVAEPKFRDVPFESQLFNFTCYLSHSLQNYKSTDFFFAANSDHLVEVR